MVVLNRNGCRRSCRNNLIIRTKGPRSEMRLQGRSCSAPMKKALVRINQISTPQPNTILELVSSPNAPVHPHTFYAIPPYQFPPYNNYQLSPYGQQPQQQPQWSVPLSSYSSLNGATSGQGPSQPQRSPVEQHQSPLLAQQSPPPQPQQYQQQPAQPQQQITIE